MTFDLRNISIESMIATGFAISRFRYEFEKSYELNELTFSRAETMGGKFLSYPDVCKKTLKKYTEDMVFGHIYHSFFRDMTGEDLFKILYGETPEKPVEVKRKPYGAHLYLYMKDLVKVCPDILKDNTTQLSSGTSISNMNISGRAFLDHGISVGWRTFPTFEEWLSVQDDTKGIEEEKLKLIYQDNIQDVENTAAHELEHLHSGALGIRDPLQELLAYSKDGIVSRSKLPEKASIDEAVAIMTKAYLDYNLKDAELIVNILMNASLNYPISNLNNNDSSNLLNAIFMQMDSLEEIDANLPRILEGVRKYKAG